jgi:hypothetical protein
VEITGLQVLKLPSLRLEMQFNTALHVHVCCSRHVMRDEAEGNGANQAVDRQAKVLQSILCCEVSFLLVNNCVTYNL